MNRVKKLVGGILAITLCVSVSAQTKLPPGWQSSYVKITPEGELAYYPDKQGNTIPDFSRVGYHHGDKSIFYKLYRRGVSYVAIRRFIHKLNNTIIVSTRNEYNLSLIHI